MKNLQLGGNRYKDKPIRGFAIVDDKDYRKLSKYKWYLSKLGYPVRGVYKFGKVTKVYLHTEILGKKTGYQVDHINGNKSDNRRKNLRFVTQRHNTRNRDIRGYIKTKNGKYLAFISVARTRINIGTFATEKEAIKARKDAEIEYWGENSLRYRTKTTTNSVEKQINISDILVERQKFICEICGVVNSHRIAGKRFCGDQKQVGTCAYKHIQKIRYEWAKKWRQKKIKK